MPPADSPRPTAFRLGGGPSQEEIARNWPRFRGPGGLGICDERIRHHLGRHQRQGRSCGRRRCRCRAIIRRWFGAIASFCRAPTSSRAKSFASTPQAASCSGRHDSAQHAAEPRAAAESQRRHGLCRPDHGHRRPPGVSPSSPTATWRPWISTATWLWSRRAWGMPNSDYGHASSLADLQEPAADPVRSGTAAKENLSKLHGPGRVTAAKSSGQHAAAGAQFAGRSPIVIHSAGRDQIITTADPWVIAYNPADGKEIWRANCLRQDIGPSPVFAGGMVYVANAVARLVGRSAPTARAT